MMRSLLLALVLGGCQVAQPEDQANSPNPILNSVDAQPTIEKATSSSLPGAGDPNVRLGTCHMDACTWRVVVGQAIVKQSEYGKLIRLMLRGGESANIVDMSDEEADLVPIRWNRSPHDVYVLCSKSLPAVAIAVDGQYQVDVLDFAGGVPAVLESSASIYGDTCHLGDEDFADSYGPLAAGFDEIEVANPIDLLDRAKEAAEREK